MDELIKKIELESKHISALREDEIKDGNIKGGNYISTDKVIELCKEVLGSKKPILKDK